MPRVLDELEQHHATSVTRGIHVDQRVHANVDDSRFSQHARHPGTDGPVDPVHFRVGVEKLQKTRLRGEGGIASLSRRVRLVEGDDTTWPDESDHLRDQSALVLAR